MTFFDCCPGSVSIEDESSPSSPRDSSTKSNIGRMRLLESAAPWSAINCNSPVNPYQVLELRKDATTNEIIRSYRKLALIHHPGRKIACPLERRKRLEYFEVLAACYETLMHSDFRKKCDVLLKEFEKKQNNQTKTNKAKSSYRAITAGPSMTRQSSKQLVSSSRSAQETDLVVKGTDSILGLMSSIVGSNDSNETLQRNNCSAMSSMLICAGGPKTLRTTSSNSIGFAISRDGAKGYRSLADSSSLSPSQASAEEDAEIHFSEATVNRLFGGPLASLHRARNFQAFSDPYVVFDKVFGNRKPIFPKVTMADINASLVTENPLGDEEDHWHESPVLIRSSASALEKKGKKIGPADQSANTEVFVSARFVNGRKITKTETVHVDPLTGIASVNVTVDGEFLESKTEKKSSNLSGGGGVADWLLCFGMGRSKVAPLGTTASTDVPSPKSSACCPTNESGCPSKDKLSSSCNGIKSLYVDALEDFYLCNNNFYQECNRYMRCGNGNEILDEPVASG